MEPQPSNTPLIVIVGETASGKSRLAMQLAQQFNGEIICADSRTVYKDMDIGTAKPTSTDRTHIPHHLVDIVTPDEAFAVADFKRLAEQAIQNIANRGKLPIMVGGTGLYIDAVLFDYQFRPLADPKLRAELKQLSVEELQQRITEQDLVPPTNIRNPRHLIRTLEANGIQGTNKPLRQNTLIIGLKLERSKLEARITQRVDEMVTAGLVDEVKHLAERYDQVGNAMQTPVYKAFGSYVAGKINLEEAKALFARSDLQLAKRQRTWFKRNNSIHWVSNPRQAVDLATTYLNNKQ